MTQLPQDEFETCLEKAEAWMKEIHERLKENDNTQGPRSALECRLRETEKICALEPDGKLLLDVVLMKAEAQLGESSDDEKHQIHIKLGEIKAKYEETITYMTHCHSRIEWVWLHWNEYLRARDDFTAWVHNMTLLLEPDLELQLGLKEKGWQYEQALVIQRDIKNQYKLLERLLEEAASLYNRIGDPSVDESVQNDMAGQYSAIKKKAQDRLKHLEKIWKEHEAYDREVSLFKAWLNDVIEKLKQCVGSASESTETRLNILLEIGKDVEIGNTQIEVLEMKSAEVVKNTSPMGAEKICKELEELRRTLQELKLMSEEEEEALLKTYNSENAFLQLAEQLEANIQEFRKAIQRLEESLECGVKAKSEDELIALWKTLNVTKTALAGEEAKAERVKVQLRDLFKFSKDVQALSDGVIAAMREYQRAKSKTFKLSTEAESELRQLFQRPLREFLYWKPIAESVLETTAVAANNGTVTPDSLQRIEKLLEESALIKERLSALEEKRERIQEVFGEDKTRLLLRDVTAAQEEREELHRHLLERRSQLQALASLMEEFELSFKSLQQKLAALRVRCAKEEELQPDIIGKEGQLQRLQIILNDLTKLHKPIKKLSKIEASPGHAHRASKLLSDHLTLQRALEYNIRNTTEYINKHWMFNYALLDLQRWVMETRQEVESYQDGSREWGDREAEDLLAELSEKDVQRHQVEAQGQLVMDSSSPEGAAHIHNQIQQLIESWESLRELCNQLTRSYGTSLSSSGILDDTEDDGFIYDQQYLEEDLDSSSFYDKQFPEEDFDEGSFSQDNKTDNHSFYKRQYLEEDRIDGSSYVKSSLEEDSQKGSSSKKQTLEEDPRGSSSNKLSWEEESKKASSSKKQSREEDSKRGSFSNKQSLEEENKKGSPSKKQHLEENPNKSPSYNKQSLEEDPKRGSSQQKQSLEEDPYKSPSSNKQSLEEDLKRGSSSKKYLKDHPNKSSSSNKKTLEEDPNERSSSLEEDPKRGSSSKKQSLKGDSKRRSSSKKSLEDDPKQGSSYQNQSLEEDPKNGSSYKSPGKDPDTGSHKKQSQTKEPNNSSFYIKQIIEEDHDTDCSKKQPQENDPHNHSYDDNKLSLEKDRRNGSSFKKQHSKQHPEEDPKYGFYNDQSLEEGLENGPSFDKQSLEEDLDEGSYKKASPKKDLNKSGSYKKPSQDEDLDKGSFYHRQSLEDDPDGGSYNRKDPENGHSNKKQSPEKEPNKRSSYKNKSLEEDLDKSSLYHSQSLEEDPNGGSYNRESLEEDPDNRSSHKKPSPEKDPNKRTSYRSKFLEEDLDESSYHRQSPEEDFKKGTHNRQSLEEDSENRPSLEEYPKNIFFNKKQSKKDPNKRSSFRNEFLEEDLDKSSFYHRQSPEEDSNTGNDNRESLEVDSENRPSLEEDPKNIFFNKKQSKKDPNKRTSYKKQSLDEDLDNGSKYLEEDSKKDTHNSQSLEEDLELSSINKKPSPKKNPNQRVSNKNKSLEEGLSDRPSLEEDNKNSSISKKKSSEKDLNSRVSYEKQSLEEDSGKGSFKNTSFKKQSPEKDPNDHISYKKKSLEEDFDEDSFHYRQSKEEDPDDVASGSRQSLEEDHENRSFYKKQSPEKDPKSRTFNKKQSLDEHSDKGSFYNRQSPEEDRENRTSYKKQSPEKDPKSPTSYKKLSLEEDPDRDYDYNKKSLEDDPDNGSFYSRPSLEEDHDKGSYYKKEDPNKLSFNKRQSLEDHPDNGSFYYRQSTEDDLGGGSFYDRKSPGPDKGTYYKKQSLEEDPDKSSLYRKLVEDHDNGSFDKKKYLEENSRKGLVYNKETPNSGRTTDFSSDVTDFSSSRSSETGKGDARLRIHTGSPDRLVAENRLIDGERNPQKSAGRWRRNRKIVSLAESVDVRDSPAEQSAGGGNTAGGDHMALLMEFEQWLHGENNKLSRICSEEITDTKSMTARRSGLQKLQSRVPQGQKLFEVLLLCRSSMAVTEDLRLEDLRYQWMLYKSKLREAGKRTHLHLTQEPRDVTKKSGSACALLHRACCAALPLQLLLLSLLLLAFLLPLVYENQNCALANNFARSFNLMLKYDGPPPT